jgi:phosphoribosylaminoimidazole (AIR) synthetase
LKPLSYREAGVDIDAGDDAVRRVPPLARATARPEVIGGIGGFASFVGLPKKFQDPVLVSSTDGVGSKLKVAFLADRHDVAEAEMFRAFNMGIGYVAVVPRPAAERAHVLSDAGETVLRLGEIVPGARGVELVA